MYIYLEIEKQLAEALGAASEQSCKTIFATELCPNCVKRNLFFRESPNKTVDPLGFSHRLDNRLLAFAKKKKSQGEGKNIFRAVWRKMPRRRGGQRSAVGDGDHAAGTLENRRCAAKGSRR